MLTQGTFLCMFVESTAYAILFVVSAYTPFAKFILTVVVVIDTSVVETMVDYSKWYKLNLKGFSDSDSDKEEISNGDSSSAKAR